MFTEAFGKALIAAAALVAGTVVAPAAAHADPACLGTPLLGPFMNPTNPVLTTASTTASIYISYSGDVFPPDFCSDVTATVQKTDGTHVSVVPFDGRGGTGMPPAMHIIATIPIPLSDGAGDWVVTKVTSGPDSKTVSVPFKVTRGTTTTIEQPATVTSPAKTTVTGLVRRYTSAGTLVPAAAGTAVRIMHSNGTNLIASAKTDSAGRYKVLVPFTVNTTMRAETPDFSGYSGSTSGFVTAHIRAALIRLVNSSSAVVNDWWRIDGQAYPGNSWTHLEYWNGSTWVSTQSFGNSNADGTFTRWWKPRAPGTFKVRITISKNNVDGMPIVREKTVTVVSKQTQPTYLSGTVGPTSDPVVHDGTKMSTYGHLKVRYTNGTVGPFANQQILVQVRQLTNPIGAWGNYAVAQTTSTGYYYANWNAFGSADLEVRVVFDSPYVTIKSAVLNLGVVDVQ